MYQRIFRCLLILLACCLFQPARAQCILDDLAKDLQSPSPGFEDFIKGNSEGMMAYKKLAANSKIRQDVDVLKATSDLLSRHAGYFRDNPGKFERIISNLARRGVRCKTCTGVNDAIPSLEVIINDLDWALANFKDKKVDIQKLINEMAARADDANAANAAKAEGGAYMLSVVRTEAKQAKSADEYINSIKSFEYRYLPNGNFEADLARSIGKETHLWEYKSWGKASWDMFNINKKYTAQLKAYLKSGGKFEYVSNVTKLNGEVDNPLQYVKNKFLTAFSSDPTLFDANPSFFKNIKFGKETIDINTFEQLQDFCKTEGFVNSSLFNFVKVK